DDLTALELWSTLATTYSQVSEARFLQLRRQFQDIKRGTRTVLEYLNEIKSVSDQLAAIGHPVGDKDKVQQALSGLGTKFDIFCTALEVLPILPSFEDLKAKLFQHEASRVQRQNLIPSNSHNVLITGTHAMQGHHTRPWTPQAGMGRGILPTPPGTNTTSSTPRRVPTCFYCNKRGHVKSECWHNPQNKNNHIRREGKAAAGAASSSSGQNVASNIPADAQQLLMTAISKLQLKQNEQGEWYVDSGVAAHVTGDTGNLSSVFPYLGQGSVVTGDGSHHTISHVGNARISMGNSSIPLKNVLVVPSVKKSIISVSKLIDDTHSSVEFTPSSVYVKDVRTKKTFTEGTRKGDMYVLEEAPTMSKQPRLSESCFPSHSEYKKEETQFTNFLEHNKDNKDDGCSTGNEEERDCLFGQVHSKKRLTATEVTGELNGDKNFNPNPDATPSLDDPSRALEMPVEGTQIEAGDEELPIALRKGISHNPDATPSLDDPSRALEMSVEGTQIEAGNEELSIALKKGIKAPACGICSVIVCFHCFRHCSSPAAVAGVSSSTAVIAAAVTIAANDSSASAASCLSSLVLGIASLW
ncbi:Retrovirus-related Pol polyprotein from transposon TNT 1-94, partial [Nymphaea thermarum]